MRKENKQKEEKRMKRGREKMTIEVRRDREKWGGRKE